MDQITTQKTQLTTHREVSADKSFHQQMEVTDVFFEHSDDLLAVLDFKGKFSEYNPTWEKELGYSNEDLKKKSFLKLVCSADQKKTKRLLKEVRLGNLFPQFENRLYTINGDMIWVRWNLMVDHDRKYIFIQGKEITRVKQNEEQLKFQLDFEELISRISNKLLIEPIERTDDTIHESLEIIGEFLNVDRVVFHKVIDSCFNVKLLYGWYSNSQREESDVIGKGFCLKDFPWAYQQLQHSGVFYVPSVDKISLQHREEKDFLEENNVVSYLSTYINIQDKFQGFFYISTHQTERMWSKDSIALVKILGQVFSNAVQRKEVIDVLRNRSIELEKSNKELEQFAYVASHDLKEPLRMISSYVQLLNRKYENRLDEDSKEFISYAVDGVKRMQNLINDLLEYSKIGKNSIPPVSTDIEEIIDIVKLNLSELIAENQAIIKVKKLPKIQADPSQMIQLFQNLIDNAIKFRNSKRPKIEIGFKDVGDYWTFYIKDNGIGIDPAYRDKIFVIFQRLNNRNVYNGNGIGLTICKRIVENHGGKIWFESIFGKGTNFYFSIKKQVD